MSSKLALLSLVILSPIVSIAQTRPAVKRAQAQTAQAAPVRPANQTPLDRLMLPYLKSHVPAASAAQPSKPAAMETSDAASSTGGQPNFGGYVSAPFFPAHLESSCISDPYNCAAQAELTADFNKDGKPDLAVVQADGTLNILLNNGNGIFPTPVSYLNPNFSSSYIDQAFAVDVNSDGYADIVAVDINNNALIVYLNQKNGTFGAAQTIPMDSSNGSIGSIAVGDVNNDGVPDVVAVFLNQLSQNSTAVTVETYLGTGTGSFNSPTAADIQTSMIAAQVQIPYNTGISLGDLNKDGKLDVAIDLEEQTSFSAGEVVATIALGNGDGSFAPINVTNPITLPVTGGFFLLFNTIGVQITDLNNDGNPDLAMDQNGTLYVALGSGSGTFPSTVQTPGLGESLQILYADLNGDGIPDFVQNANDLNVWTGKGDGTFTRPIGNTYEIDPGGGQTMVAADFTGDGNVDVAQMGEEYNQISLFAGNGKGALYGAPILTSTTDATFDAAQFSIEAAADIAGNGLTDPIFVDVYGSSPYIVSGLSDGKGGFTYTTALAAAAVPNLAYLQPIQADFNGDGKQDLLIAGSDKSLSVALSNGDGSFKAPVKLSLPALDCEVNYAATGDLNGDGHADIVVTYPGDAACGGSDSTPSGYFVALGNGDGTFATPLFTASGNELYSATIADINLDTIPDLILNDEPLSGNGTFSINLLTGNGDGTFSTGTSVYSNFVVTQVIAGDYNQDGKPDLILFSEGEATDLANSGSLDTAGIILLPGNGDGTFDSSTQLGTGHWFVNGVLTDVNHDGIPDIVTALYHSAAAPTTYFGLATLLGTGNGGFTPPINNP